MWDATVAIQGKKEDSQPLQPEHSLLGILLQHSVSRQSMTQGNLVTLHLLCVVLVCCNQSAQIKQSTTLVFLFSLSSVIMRMKLPLIWRS